MTSAAVLWHMFQVGNSRSIAMMSGGGEAGACIHVAPHRAHCSPHRSELHNAVPVHQVAAYVGLRREGTAVLGCPTLRAGAECSGFVVSCSIAGHDWAGSNLTGSRPGGSTDCDDSLCRTLGYDLAPVVDVNVQVDQQHALTLLSPLS